MRKILVLIIVALFIISTPFITLSIMEKVRVQPEGKLAELPPVTPPKEPQPNLPPEKPAATPEKPKAEPKKEEEKTASPEFLKGYWDGYMGYKMPIFKFSLSEDYRQGHMLGVYDKKHDIKRYAMPKELLKDDKKKDDKKKE